MLGLAGVTVYNLLVDPASRVGTNNAASLNHMASSNSQTREQDMQGLIERNNSRLVELQKENQQREGEIAQQEVRLTELTQTLVALKARFVPNSSGSSSGSGALSPSPNTDYLAQVKQLEGQITTLKQAINDKQQGLDQLQNSFNDYNAELASLTGTTPTLPGSITDLEAARLLRPPVTLPATTILVTSPFGGRDNPFEPGTRSWHDGVDLACTLGDPVHATKTGIVTFAGQDHNGYGLRVDITHENGWLSFYGHNSKILVQVGQRVNQGDVLSLCGSTGASTGPHIHYGLHFNGVMTDPLRYITFPVKKDFGIR